MFLPEIVSVGIFNSQLTSRRPVTRNRKTTMFELELPIDDAGTSYIDSGSRKITRNLVICAKPGQTRHSKLPYKCYYVHMIVPSGQLYDTLMALPDFIDYGDTEHICELFQKMNEHFRSGAGDDLLMLQSLILELVYLLRRRAPADAVRHKIKSNNHAVIEKTLEYIRNNLTAELTLESLAREASFSTIYFHRLFKASTGKTLHAYIEDLRIKKSVDLLISTNMTLSQIAYECGFSSQSYYSFAFKRSMGMPPRAYARKLVEQYD